MKLHTYVGYIFPGRTTIGPGYLGEPGGLVTWYTGPSLRPPPRWVKEAGYDHVLFTKSLHYLTIPTFYREPTSRNQFL